MEWEEFLTSKKIDTKAFKENEPSIWSEWKFLFEQMHPKSFVAQKLYLINPIRRKYPLQEEVSQPTVIKKPAKPVIKAAKPNVKAKPKVGPAKPIIKRPKTD